MLFLVKLIDSTPNHTTPEFSRFVQQNAHGFGRTGIYGFSTVCSWILWAYRLLAPVVDGAGLAGGHLSCFDSRFAVKSALGRLGLSLVGSRFYGAYSKEYHKHPQMDQLFCYPDRQLISFSFEDLAGDRLVVVFGGFYGVGKLRRILRFCPVVFCGRSFIGAGPVGFVLPTAGEDYFTAYAHCNFLFKLYIVGLHTAGTSKMGISQLSTGSRPVESRLVQQMGSFVVMLVGAWVGTQLFRIGGRFWTRWRCCTSTGGDYSLAEGLYSRGFQSRYYRAIVAAFRWVQEQLSYCSRSVCSGVLGKVTGPGIFRNSAMLDLLVVALLPVITITKSPAAHRNHRVPIAAVNSITVGGTSLLVDVRRRLLNGKPTTNNNLMHCSGFFYS